MSQSSTAPVTPNGFWSKLRLFAVAVYEPKLHTAFALLWALSLQGALFALADPQTSWAFDFDGVVVGLCFFLVLFFLRIIDEIKDYDDDKQFKPDRPLVTGVVNFTDVKRFAWLVATSTLAINLMLDWRLALFALANMLYGVLLFYLECWSEHMRNGIMLNLLITFPVSAALNVYALLFLIWRHQVAYVGTMGWMIVAYICAFLHFDVGRKTVWPHLMKPNEKLYAHEIGGMGSALLALALALTACGVPWLLYQPWQHSGSQAILGWSLLLPLVASVAGFIKFTGTRDRRYEPRPFYMVFVILYYFIQLANGVAALRG
ncbi:MAG: hypothetical protein KME46_18735 [Brasilonema angustatum HA4187-MV1]|jgi:4-hydroxybenzoate polyprenyltransferase|nr:hypothetical protein [Brasilonema angustatum HA4187-MV1]